MAADLEACRVFDGTFSLQLFQTRISILLRVWNLTDQTVFLQLKNKTSQFQPRCQQADVAA